MQRVVGVSVLYCGLVVLHVSGAQLRSSAPKLANATLTKDTVMNSTASSDNELDKSNTSSVLTTNFGLASKLMDSHIPEARECGAALNQAWKALAKTPCTAEMHRAKDVMLKNVPTCKKLRQGAEYITSYGELLRQIDTWCTGPNCKSKCGDGTVCFRSRVFPFEPSCTKCSEQGHTGAACKAHDVDCVPPCDKFANGFVAQVKSSGPKVADATVANFSMAKAPLVNTTASSDNELDKTNTAAVLATNFGIAGKLMDSDIPEARECGAAMNQAWKAMAKTPCTAEMHRAKDVMLKKVPMCRELRQGAEYVTSYGELLRQIDTWCKGPKCESECSDGTVCFRSKVFPFEPSCTKCSERGHTGAACKAHDVDCVPPCDKFANGFVAQTTSSGSKLTDTSATKLSMAKAPVVNTNTSSENELKKSNAAAALATNLGIATKLMDSHIPEARECGAALNQAWKAMAKTPCTAEMHRAKDVMFKKVPMCKKLRQGAEYVTSYGELLRQIDTWCTGPKCKSECGDGTVCFRSKKFPFEPSCTKCSDRAHTGAACKAHDVDCVPPCDKFANGL